MRLLAGVFFPTATALTLSLLALSPLPSLAADEPMLGFDKDAAATQRQLEAEFDRHLSSDDIESWIERLSARPHHVGSPYGKESAEFMVELFRSWGFEAELAAYEMLFPTPKVRRLELIEPTSFVASLQEEALPEDSTSGQTDEQLPPYNAYSIDGDVTGELVYVNYGVPADYEELEKRGISVEGKIVIARYGGSWRGIKPKVAAEEGAIGCILYSDPRDDGYRAGDAYPDGGYRPAQGVQRGSVADMPLYPGDPSTPGFASLPGVERQSLDQIATLTKIPVLPISYGDAQPLLTAIGGPLAPADWQGDLPITYHLGPGPAKVHLTLEFDWGTAMAYNVVAKIEGSELPDQWILRGNHHDAWVNGATDPVSGMAAVLAEAKAFGQLMQAGWKPRRTIVYAGWDAEEPGLLGSTEWVEHHAEELNEKAVVYINSDSNGRGFLYAGGSHSLQKFVNEVAGDVEDPQVGGSVLDRLRAGWRLWEGDPERRDAAESGSDLPLHPLGSGSDFTPFLQHIGIASLNIGFGGEGHYGQYHSVYDSFDHYKRFMDPEFEYGVALSKLGGRLVLRLANSEVLPFEFGALVSTIGRYSQEVQDLADELRKATERDNALLEDGVYAAVWDPRENWSLPQAEEPVPFLNFSPLDNALAGLEQSLQRFESSRGEGKLSQSTRASLDQLMMRSERALTRDHGLPGRPWFVHHIYAPGFYTGYGVKTLPGVREAIEERDWKGAAEQIRVAAEVLQELGSVLDEATKLLAEEMR